MEEVKMNTNKKLLIISPNEEREGTKIKTCNLTCLHLISLYIYIYYIFVCFRRCFLSFFEPVFSSNILSLSPRLNFSLLSIFC